MADHGEIDEDEAEDLYQHTDRDQIDEWLTYCETDADTCSDWEQEFLESVREKFDERSHQEHPLTGKQLVVLKRIYEKL